MSIKPLGLVKEIVESSGMEISHAYDDLVFLNHNALLLQFTDSGREVLIHMNSAAAQQAVDQDILRLQQAAFRRGMKFYAGQLFTIEQADGENVRIKFTPVT